MTAVEWFAIRLLEGNYTDEEFHEMYLKALEIQSKQRQADTDHGYSQGWDDGARGKEPARPSLL